MRLLLLIRSLDAGGAEIQLVNLAIGLKKLGHNVAVAVFYGGGVLEDRLRGADVPVHSLRKRGRWDIVGFSVRLIHLLRSTRPSVLYTSLEGANIVGAVCKPLLGNARLVWRIAIADYDTSTLGWLSRLGYRLEDVLSRLPDAIVSNSVAGRKWTIGRGFPANRVQVVENGIDTVRFRPDAETGRLVRKELGIPVDAKVVGITGRIENFKRHDLFLRASASLVEKFPEVYLLCVGGGDQRLRDDLAKLAGSLGLSDRIKWTGFRRDTERLYNAMDLLCLSSDAEGFPNVVGEAMACGIPAVVTDVGDAGHIVGGCGRVVPPSSSERLQVALSELLALPQQSRQQMGACGRKRIIDQFSIDRMITATLDILEPLARPTDQ